MICKTCGDDYTDDRNGFMEMGVTEFAGWSESYRDCWVCFLQELAYSAPDGFSCDQGIYEITPLRESAERTL